MTYKSISLHSGDRVPQVGLGFWKVSKERCPSLVHEAIEGGCRHFDCAADYGNEAEVGEGLATSLAKGLCDRDDLWVTSKLWNTFHHPDHVRQACERSLNDLKLDYLDLYLIHFPISLAFVPFDVRYPPEWFHDPDAPEPTMKSQPVPIQETWRAMEALQRDGLVKNIGVANFGVSLLRDLMSYAEIPPAVLQVESHPHLTQQKLMRFCHEHKIAFTAFSPLGAQSYVEIGMADSKDSLLESTTISAIAQTHGKSPAQVLLRWGVQREGAVVVKTSSIQRLRENLSVFDFELSETEMKEVDDLNINRRYNDPGVFCEQAFNTFFPIFE